MDEQSARQRAHVSREIRRLVETCEKPRREHLIAGLTFTLEDAITRR